MKKTTMHVEFLPPRGPRVPYYLPHKMIREEMGPRIAHAFAAEDVLRGVTTDQRLIDLAHLWALPRWDMENYYPFDLPIRRRDDSDSELCLEWLLAFDWGGHFEPLHRELTPAKNGRPRVCRAIPDEAWVIVDMLEALWPRIKERAGEVLADAESQRPAKLFVRQPYPSIERS